MKRIVITGGGTGGHLYPALAVAEALKQHPDVESLLYIGNINRKEAELVPQFGIRFEGIRFSGMPRSLSPALFGWGFSFIKAFRDARCILAEYKPHVAFGTGGYVTAPVLFAAKSLGVPYVVHEPDAYPGLVNRLMGRWATEMTCAFAGARDRLVTRQLHVTGNPLRSQIGQVEREEALKMLNLPFTFDKPILLVTGGSQGARRINQGILEALPTLIDALHLQIIHQTGEALYEEVMSQCPEAYRDHPAYRVQPFIQDMGATLALADVAICRSGSMTLSEMYRAHIPTILVPYPFAAADHQRMNALASQDAGASLMIEDARFTGERVVDALQCVLSDADRKARMTEASAALAHPKATEEVLNIILRVGVEKSY